jgi:hypothetical protein
MEFSADSGGSSESSTMSDGDSVNINNNSQHLLRMTSGASMTETTDVEDKGRVRGSMLEENEGENEVDEDVNIRPESPARLSDDLETHSIQREPESAATTWTDDKHSSFLDTMEATFVRSLFGQQGLGHLGVYGNSAQNDDPEQDCVESRPADGCGCGRSNPAELSELVQGGPLQQKPHYKPHGLEQPPASTTPSVLANPWVRHFKQRTSKQHDEPSACPADATATLVKEVGSAVDVSPTIIENIENMIGATTIGKEVEENEQSGASEDTDCKGTDSCFEGSGLDQGLRSWQNRLQGGGPSGMIPSSRKDMASFVLKRPPTFDIDNADVFVTKRMKSAQHELAQKDLEMLEEFVAKQRAENVQAAGEHSEQATLEHARKMVETSADEAGPSSASEQKEIRKVAGRSAMDQVVPLLGRMDSYESRSSLSFPDLNAPSSGAACTVSEPVLERRNLPSVPDLNAPVRMGYVPSAYTTNQPTINFTKDGEAVAKAWSPRPTEVGREEERYFHELTGAPPCVDLDDHGGNVNNINSNNNNELSLELQTKCLEAAAGEAFDCSCGGEPQLSPLSNSRTWTWGLGGLRRRLHDHTTLGGVPASSQPSRALNLNLRDGIHS